MLTTGEPYAERMGVELHQLRALLAVVEHGSFTDAGIALGLSQAAVSRAVAGLEARLGVRVLRRTTRSVGLTRPGVRVVEHARRVLDAVAALERVPAENPDDVRVGYAWSALGAHTVTVQRAWAREHPGTDLVFLQSSTATAGLAEGLVDVAVLRRPVHDARVATAMVGTELRYAALATHDPLARRRGLVLADFAGRTIAVDPRTGTTDSELWPAGDGPTVRREVRGIEDFLTCVAAGQAVGITSVATSRQHRRPGVAYRRVRDAPPLTVTLAWWRDEPPPAVPSLLALVRSAYAGTS
jgi:DNA-binding transcriptional LysR family regulator